MFSQKGILAETKVLFCQLNLMQYTQVLIFPAKNEISKRLVQHYCTTHIHAIQVFKKAGECALINTKIFKNRFFNFFISHATFIKSFYHIIINLILFIWYNSSEQTKTKRIGVFTRISVLVI